MGLSSGLGKKKKVENLTELIRLKIPNKTPVPTPKTYIGYCQLMLNVHLVECDVNASVIIMYIKPNLENSNITGDLHVFAFMNKGLCLIVFVICSEQFDVFFTIVKENIILQMNAIILD